MDVLGGNLKFDLAVIDILKYFKKGRADKLRFIGRDDSALSQHADMGRASLNILPVHPAVEMNGRIKIIHKAVRILIESAAPKLHELTVLNPRYC